jgi:VWFA-related protein
MQVNVVSIDVTVTDRDGNPITDLTSEDFRILEDGDPVKITNFIKVVNRVPVPASAPVAPRSSEDETSGTTNETASKAAVARGESLYLVLFIDNLNLQPFSRNRVFSRLRELLRDVVTDGAQVMLVSHDRALQVRVPFTTDISRVNDELLEMEDDSGMAVQRFEERRIALDEIAESSSEHRALSVAHRFAETEFFDVEGTIGKVHDLVETIGGLRGRKAIVYVSEGIPMVAGEDLFYAANEKYRMAGAISEARGYDLSRKFTALASFANTHRVTFYTLDAAGLRTTSTSDPQQRTVIRSTLVDSQNIHNLQASIVLLADQTGGRIARDTNDFGPFMKQIATSLGTYYSIGYPVAHHGDGRYHRLEVEVDRKKVEVRHRDGYRDITVEQRMRDATLAALNFEEDDNPLEIAVRFGDVTERDQGNYSVPIVVMIPYDNVVLIPRDDSFEANVRLFMAAMDQDATTSEVQEIAVPLSLPADQRELARGKVFPFSFPLIMAEGRHKITLSVRDDFGGTVSFVTVRLQVGVTSDPVPAPIPESASPKAGEQ